jgi:predicted TIM-barrel fold metal-dependent hydrolase
MLIVDSQIHLWQNGRMSAHHRQIPTYSVDDALAEMASAGVDCAVIHPPSALGEAVNVLAVEAVRRHPAKFCILGHFDLQSADRENIVAHWRERPSMLGFRFTLRQASIVDSQILYAARLRFRETSRFRADGSPPSLLGLD